MLKIELFYPIFDKNNEENKKVERICAFYEQIVNNCKIFAQEALFDKIKAEYASLCRSGERRKFKKYIYRFKCSADTENENEPYVFVRVRASLLRAGRVIASNEILHKWDVLNGTILRENKDAEKVLTADKPLDKEKHI